MATTLATVSQSISAQSDAATASQTAAASGTSASTGSASLKKDADDALKALMDDIENIQAQCSELEYMYKNDYLLTVDDGDAIKELMVAKIKRGYIG